MKKRLFAIATGLGLTAGGLLAQGSSPMINSFQDVTSIISSLPLQMAAMGGQGSLVTGAPVSAQEVNKTVQTLSDGTQLENSRSTMFYRDAQGRTRTEPSGGNGPILILDPVAAVRITITPATKTAHRAAAPALAAGRGGRATVYTYSNTGGTAYTTTGDAAALADKLKAEALASTPRVVLDKLNAERGAANRKEKDNVVTEDLGFQNQNGVLAQGTRTTLTIPTGQIGNNRDIHVVNERWYSKDLQMVVKSINSDPRFGVTTYDLTNIVQAADPSLFQIPSSYNIVEGPAGRRGGVVVMGK